MRSASILATCLLLAGCGDQATLVELMPQQDRLDLAAALPGDWDRGCVLQPYASTHSASQLLGFTYAPEAVSSISMLDDRNLLVTVKENQAAGAYEVLFRNVNLTPIGGQCYARDKATFARDKKQVWRLQE